MNKNINSFSNFNCWWYSCFSFCIICFKSSVNSGHLGGQTETEEHYFSDLNIYGLVFYHWNPLEFWFWLGQTSFFDGKLSCAFRLSEVIWIMTQWKLELMIFQMIPSHLFNLETMVQILNWDINQQMQIQNLRPDSAFSI